MREREFQGALLHAESALAQGRELDSPQVVAWALDLLGNGHEGLAQWEEATAAYTESVAIKRSVDADDNAAMEPLAGLARVALAAGNEEAALEHVEAVLAHLAAGSLDGTDFPVLIHLTCYRVLDATGDARARVAIAEAHRILREQTDRIRNPDVRRAFLENVAENRAVVRLYACSEMGSR